MDYKLELSKFHLYIDVEKFEDFEKSLPKDYDESKIEESARLNAEQRNALPDSDFAVVVRVKNKKTGKMRKIRMFPIHDKAHVKNALERLGQPASKAILAKLGISIEAVKAKILRKAKPEKKVEPKVKKIEKKVEVKAEKKVEVKKDKVKVEKVKDTLSDAKKHDLEVYALKDKIAKYAKGIRKLAARIRSNKKELEVVKAEKEKEVKFYKENAKKIHDRKKELGNFAKDLSDEDIINEDKFEKAQLKKQVAEAQTIEIASENVKDKVTGVNEYTDIKKRIDKSAFPEVKG